MTLLAESSVDIACPVELAFAFAADLENFPRWFPGVIAVASADALPPATVGKHYREEVAMPLRGRRSVPIRVVEAVAPHHFVTEGELPLLLPRMEIAFAVREAGGCRVTWRMSSRRTQGWARWTILPLARRVMARRAGIGLLRLKRHLEAARPGA
jgi:hypothetical protein